MAESRKEENVGGKEYRPQAALIAPVPPEVEMPGPLQGEREKGRTQAEASMCSDRQGRAGSVADTELEIMLTQIETYFLTQARHHDLEAISFTLRHLFSRVDFLYCQALPELGTWTSREDAEREMLLSQQIWLHLQTINRTLDRMAPLCHLLSDVIECLLETLDNEELWLRTRDPEDTLQLEQTPAPAQPHRPGFSFAYAPDIWERAASTLMDRLLLWQEYHHKLTPFQRQFARPALAGINLGALDTAFAVLLDSAGAIFGDILPNFRLAAPENHDEISALLFDLMQQSDQMLVQFEVTLGPLTGLLRHFATISESG